jgi:IclR family transcriptional regulator, acetate operon repressor
MSEERSNNGKRSTPPGRIQVLDRAVAVLNSFTPEHAKLGVTEIARLTGLTRGTAHRIVANLESHQLVQRVQPGNRYTLGPGLLRLAYSARVGINLQECAEPIMMRLRDETNETVGLHVVDGEFNRKVIDQVESRHSIRRTYTNIGEPIPIHQGAPGKALLAHLPTEVQQEVFSGPLEAATYNTIVDPELLKRELESVLDKGFAISLAERVPEVRTIAVPVFDYRESVVAALSVTGPSSRVDKEHLLEFAPHALQAAKDLSFMLGSIEYKDYSPDNPPST